MHRSRRARYLLALGLFITLPLTSQIVSAAAVAEELQTPDQQDVAPLAVDIKQFMFAPATVEAPVGTTINWTNRDAIEHSVTEGSPDMSPAFDSGFFIQEQSWSFTLTEPGTFHYYCQRHPFMQGDLIVTPIGIKLSRPGLLAGG
jgi:plastocyanin